MVRTLHFCCKGAPIQSLVGGLRCHTVWLKHKILKNLIILDSIDIALVVFQVLF